MSVERVVDAFGLPKSPRHRTIARSEVLEWMQDEDLEALGALYGYLIGPAYVSRVEPALSADELDRFIFHYYDRCFRENPTDGKWAATRYEAGRDLVRWFVILWEDKNLPRARLDEIKEWLARLYRAGDDEMRECIVNATLEHLFERPEIARYWEDWKEDPLLAQGYADALLWSRDGGGNRPRPG